MDVTDAAIRDALDLDELREAMAIALADFSAGRSEQPVRTVVPAANDAGFLYVMPARTPTALGTKLVTLYPANVGVPTHHAIVLLFDPTTGVPIATFDGNAITELRTAAVSALAAERLARADASVLAILGSGVQAGSHLDALRRVRQLRDVRIWSPRRATTFAANRPGVRAVTSGQAAVDGADIVVTVTTSRTPVLHGTWLAPGAFVAAVGAPRPDWRELDDGVLGSARLIVDSRAAAATESGDVRRALELGQQIGAELGEVIAGTTRGRTSPDDVVVFKSLGMAVEDVAAAALVLERIPPG